MSTAPAETFATGIDFEDQDPHIDPSSGINNTTSDQHDPDQDQELSLEGDGSLPGISGQVQGQQGQQGRRRSSASLSSTHSTPHSSSASSSISHAPHKATATASSRARLPSSVNLVALRESFLSEAPFISNANRTFWRRMVDNSNFQILLSSSYYIIADCVSDTSVVNVEKLQDIDVANTPLIQTMATNISEMYYTIKLRERELLFAKLPEVLSFMALTALRTSMPKHHRLCLSAKFREILIDWYCEVVGGLRFTNCRTNREWLFTDVFDAQIVTTTQLKGGGGGVGGGANSYNSPAVHNPSSALNNTNNNTNNNSNGNTNSNGNLLGPAGSAAPATSTTEHNTISVSKQTIGLSPLVSRYTSDVSLSDLQLKISLSHLSNRALTSLDTAQQRPATAVTTAAPGSRHVCRQDSADTAGSAVAGKRTAAARTGGGGGGLLLAPSPSPSFTPGRPRMKKVDYADVRSVVKTSTAARRSIMTSLHKSVRESTHELNKSRSELKAQMSELKRQEAAEMLRAKTQLMTSSSFSAPV